MIKADTPNLWEIRSLTDHATAIAVIIKSLIHLARLLNLKPEENLNDIQMGEIANDILENMGYLKVEEIKYVLKRALNTEKIFRRLDYNVVMGWFKQYDSERTEYCMDISDQEETMEHNNPDVSSEAITLEQYMDSLWGLALYADADAVEKLSDMAALEAKAKATTTREQRHQKDVQFKSYYFLQYLKNKRI